MIRLFVAMLVALASSNTILADNGERLTSLKQLCISDQGTGFNWEKGSWVRVNFVEERFVVSKVDIPKKINLDDIEMLMCSEPVFGEWEEGAFGDNLKQYKSCLKFQSLGEKNAVYLPCAERHTKKERGNDWDVKFDCNMAGSWKIFYMEKGGNFHMGSMHANVSSDPKDDYKDSLSIFIGKCASIED